ncbi:hypothetical protein GL325_12370 [Aeromicrobium sp. 636]|uniref:DUF485 domain-containing protein n=1 Tax=Aeromicrobium senzhongii TaxID=2663859 RepID=A0A8I0EX21_9ACTN|nr:MULTISPECIES: hypothetical protein [Aeromicrobium]MBC9227119.1 hypothetical protein [Aeromicrobium senzhongii]MCQ3999219.1 hypothetical protein [Aeromicrobium sp. 636]MTB88474.1 hypothetical protein [Aeromicrobium senzhongii]QNL94564.1 hypothetical protein H9L21_00870 [Aeromicrobium senzhongii]
MTDTAPPPPEHTGRVRVTNPLSTASPHVRSTVGQEIDEATGIGEVYMQSLIRSQLRAAATVTITLLLTVVSLPLVFLWVPGLRDASILGVPLPWLVLGGCVHAGVIVLGWLYVRHVERAERLFTQLVEPNDTSP